METVNPTIEHAVLVMRAVLHERWERRDDLPVSSRPRVRHPAHLPAHALHFRVLFALPVAEQARDEVVRYILPGNYDLPTDAS
jgi:hypothetical protein